MSYRRSRKACGFIPAGGMGTRWGGFMKELLPVRDGEFLINRAVEAIPAYDIYIVTNIAKIQALSLHFSMHPVKKSIRYMVQGEGFSGQLWGAWLQALDLDYDYTYMVMPDTYLPARPFRHATIANDIELDIGFFDTLTPEKFGCIYGNRIHDKEQPPEDTSAPYRAWGCLRWTRELAELWLQLWTTSFQINSHTDALNIALDRGRYRLFNLPYYHDIADFTQYQQLIKGGFPK